MKIYYGFNLIELLIVVGILSIMVAAILPIYSEHLTKARRLAAQVTLNKLAVAAEKYQLEHEGYEGMVVPPVLQGQFYWFGIQASQAGYVLKAVPIGAQAHRDAGCGVLMVDNIGGRSQSGWKNEKACW